MEGQKNDTEQIRKMAYRGVGWGRRIAHRKELADRSDVWDYIENKIAGKLADLKRKSIEILTAFLLSIPVTKLTTASYQI